MRSPYPYRVLVAIVDSEGKFVGKPTHACFLTLAQAQDAQHAAYMESYDVAKTTEQQMHEEVIRQMARAQHHTRSREGELEIDEEAVVSEGYDNGAYVAAWVWVDFTGTVLDKEADNV